MIQRCATLHHSVYDGIIRNIIFLHTWLTARTLPYNNYRSSPYLSFSLSHPLALFPVRTLADRSPTHTHTTHTLYISTPRSISLGHHSAAGCHHAVITKVYTRAFDNYCCTFRNLPLTDTCTSLDENTRGALRTIVRTTVVDRYDSSYDL